MALTIQQEMQARRLAGIGMDNLLKMRRNQRAYVSEVVLDRAIAIARGDEQLKMNKGA